MLNSFSPTLSHKPKGRKPLCRRAFHARVTGDDRPKQKSLCRDPFFIFRYKVFTCIHLSPAHIRMAKPADAQTPAQEDNRRRIATHARFARCPLAHTFLPATRTVPRRSAHAVAQRLTPASRRPAHYAMGRPAHPLTPPQAAIASASNRNSVPRFCPCAI